MTENDTVQPAPLGPLYAALAKAQGEFRPIERTRTVTVRPKKRDDGFQPPPYTFDYAPLEEVLSKCLPALNANGLALFHRLDLKAGELVTVLSHESGATIEQSSPVRPGDWQQIGSAVTYARRYTVQCILGVAAEYDDDGNAADGNEVQGQQSRATRSQPTPPKPPAQARKQEPKPPIQPDPQVQVDIERRAEENRLSEARAALAKAEEIQGVAPAVVEEKRPSQYPAAPAENALPDAHVPDYVQLPKGAATREAMRAALTAAGFNDSVSMAAKVLEVSGVDPRATALTYGNARAVIAALAAP